MNFGEKLRKLRNNKKMTQEELAKRIGISRSTIAGYETKGKEPPYSTLVKIAEELNCSLDYLLQNKKDDAVSIDKSNYYSGLISKRGDLQQLINETEKLNPDSIYRIIEIIKIINKEVMERMKDSSSSRDCT